MSYQCNHVLCSFLNLSSSTQYDALRFFHVAYISSSLFFIAEQYPLYGYTTVYSQVKGHVGCLQFCDYKRSCFKHLCTVCVCVCGRGLGTFLFLLSKYEWDSWVVKIHGKCIFNLIEKCKTVLLSGCTILYSHQQRMRVALYLWLFECKSNAYLLWDL